MSLAQDAFARGNKAARSGRPVTANPYIDAAARRAWAEGHAYDAQTDPDGHAFSARWRSTFRRLPELQPTDDAGSRNPRTGQPSGSPR
ncbi:Rmf/CrpP family protein [Novosphingobium sp. AP12]|uniref:ribosome modulation factor n=1 Tax=Novosphingobium sp. AP12 TaxID=1144305 RepID=UPI00350E9FE2